MNPLILHTIRQAVKYSLESDSMDSALAEYIDRILFKIQTMVNQL